MRKIFSSLTAIAAVVMVFAVSESKAQLPSGAFGIGSAFAASGNMAAELHYAVSSNFDLGLGLGYTTNNPNGDVDNESGEGSMMNLGLEANYILGDASAAVNPFLSLGIGFGSENATANDDFDDVGDDSQFGVTLAFGAQAMLVKNVYMRARVGLTMLMSTTKSQPDDISGSTMNLGGSAIGVVLYL